MKYTSENFTGAAPRQRHEDGRGPVTTHHYSEMSHSQSRSHNLTESSPAIVTISDWLEDQIELARRKASEKYLKVLRAEVSQLNLRRHHVYVEAAMGSVNLMICASHPGAKVKYVDDLRGGNIGSNHVIRVLQELDQFIDGQWDWAAYLDKQVLTQHSMKVV